MPLPWRSEKGPKPSWWDAYSACIFSPAELDALIARETLHLRPGERTGDVCRIFENDAAFWFVTRHKENFFVDRCRKPAASCPAGQPTAASTITDGGNTPSEQPSAAAVPEPTRPAPTYGIGRFKNQQVMDL